VTQKDATDRFFQGLHKVSVEFCGKDSPLAQAAEKAVSETSPINCVNAQEALAQIPEELREQILRELHAHLRNDIEAIWDQMPYAVKTGRPN
jgi:predicted component of type VI protein secretion system